LLTGIVALSQPTTVLAQDENGEGELEITTKYPKIEITSGEIVEFEVELKYTSDETEPQVFDLVATAPKDWLTQISPAYPAGKKIASIQLTPTGYGEKITVQAAPPYWFKPEPGEYKITLEATSEEIKSIIELTAVITAKYALDLVPATERYDTKVTAGKDNYFSIEVQNNSSADVNDIIFSSDKPPEWAIEFSPDKVDSLSAGDYQTIDVNIKPPSKTIAGDYEITLRASGKEVTTEKLRIRVTVETPTIWGWVGVIIVAAVIVGLVFTFRRFSRR